MKYLILALKHFLRNIGIDVRRYSPQRSDSARLGRLLETYQIDCVFDIGANIGQFAEELRRVGYNGRIISFEPQRSAHSVLLKKSAKDPLWVIADPMALGENELELELNISENSFSSSIREMHQRHELVAPSSKYVEKEKVMVRTLDSVFENFKNSSSRIFLKIDTQGYESQVLKGASTTLPQCLGVQLELSLEELYVGQDLFFKTSQILLDRGFSLVGMCPGLVDNESGHLLQTDGIFFRQSISRT